METITHTVVLYIFRDILRSMKEGMKSFKEKRAPTIHGGKEQVLRAETDNMQGFKTSVDHAWKWVRESVPYSITTFHC